MLTTDLKLGDKIYKMRLTTLNSKKFAVETQLTPVDIVTNSELLKDVTNLLIIVEYSLLHDNPKIQSSDVYNMYDEMVDNDFGQEHLMALVSEILRASGQVFKVHPIKVANQLKEMGIHINPKHIMTEEENQEYEKIIQKAIENQQSEDIEKN